MSACGFYKPRYAIHRHMVGAVSMWLLRTRTCHTQTHGGLKDAEEHLRIVTSWEKTLFFWVSAWNQGSCTYVSIVNKWYPNLDTITHQIPSQESSLHMVFIWFFVDLLLFFFFGLCLLVFSIASYFWWMGSWPCFSFTGFFFFSRVCSRLIQQTGLDFVEQKRSGKKARGPKTSHVCNPKNKGCVTLWPCHLH